MEGRWFDEELAGGRHGDGLLDSRLCQLVERMDTGFGETIPQACQDWANTKAAYRLATVERELMLPRTLTCYSARPLDADKHVKLLSSLILEGSNTSAEQRRECQNPASAHLGFSGQVMASALIDHGNQIFWTCWTIW